MSNKKITITVNGIDLTFNVTLAAFNKFQNSTTMVNKVQPAHNFLTSTVDDKSKDELLKMLKQPGAPLNLVAAIVDEYQPDFEITVKK